MKLAVSLIVVSLTAVLAFPTSPAYAQIELTEADPPDGAQLDEPPEEVRVCFSQPVSVEDDTFLFRYLMPDGLGRGIRTFFVQQGECAGIIAGLPDNPPAGEYTFKWQVMAAEGDEEGSGTLHWQVGQGGATAPPSSPTPSETPPAATPSPEDIAVTEDEGEDGGPDILLLALITTGVVGGAAVLFTLGYLLRQRIGFDPHRPPEGGEGEEGH